LFALSEGTPQRQQSAGLQEQMRERKRGKVKSRESRLDQFKQIEFLGFNWAGNGSISRLTVVIVGSSWSG
jgi:hypothetical protein